jgi:hypothetical protein
MTADEFAEAYAARGGVTVEWLRERGREARPCDCGDESCDGWQMANVKEDALFEQMKSEARLTSREPPHPHRLGR